MGRDEISGIALIVTTAPGRPTGGRRLRHLPAARRPLRTPNHQGPLAAITRAGHSLLNLRLMTADVGLSHAGSEFGTYCNRSGILHRHGRWPTSADADLQSLVGGGVVAWRPIARRKARACETVHITSSPFEVLPRCTEEFPYRLKEVVLPICAVRPGLGGGSTCRGSGSLSPALSRTFVRRRLSSRPWPRPLRTEVRS